MRGQQTIRSRAVVVLGAMGLVVAAAACSSNGSARVDTTTVPTSAGAVTTTNADTTAPATTAPATTAPATTAPATTAPASTSAVTTGAPTSSAVSALTAAEETGLRWMREEEKLAHDVYQVLGDLWGARIFANITRSETSHMASVKTLLDRYGIADPAAGAALGTFADPTLQDLYDRLVAQGRQSLVEALKVGATIEELDIADLQARATTTPDIAAVYANLEQGSRNHLRAFTGQLDALGETYVPVHISQSAFDAIVSTPTEQGPEG